MQVPTLLHQATDATCNKNRVPTCLLLATRDSSVKSASIEPQRLAVGAAMRVALVLLVVGCARAEATTSEPQAPSGKVVLEGAFFRAGEGPPYTFWLRNLESEAECSAAAARYANGAPRGLTFSCREAR